MSGTAVLLANDLFRTPFAKTAHGLVRGPSRFRIAGVVDASLAGRDAGEVLDGRRRDVPIFGSLGALMAEVSPSPDHCVVGVATPGGVLPRELRAGLLEAAEAGLTLVSGLHQLLEDDAEIAGAAARGGARILDLRRPPPARELRFWSGEVLALSTPRVAVLGTDCAVGKRTTTMLLRAACREAGIRAEMVYTGQTGWLQGVEHGFLLDATPNDFVCGELERCILACQRDLDPELILLEGQSSLRNPSGPCGSELILAGGAKAVILQHDPWRELFIDMEDLGCRVPPVAEELQLIEGLGAEVWAVTLHQGGRDADTAAAARDRLAAEITPPVLLPLGGDLPELVQLVRRRLRPDQQPI